MNASKITAYLAILCLTTCLLAANVLADVGDPLPGKPGFDMHQVRHGQYLAKISGCNDCHTPGYAQADGRVADQVWLTGDVLGWRGPWGTTYASNLRLLADNMTAEQWLGMTRILKVRPPMPWFNLNAMTDDDRSAIYQFLRYLGPAGQPAPAYVPPDREPAGPYITFPAPPK